jgi:hypothetical protein
MRLPVLLLSLLTLGGCGASDMASMPIQGSEHSLTLVREQPYLWSKSWDLAMVVSRMPDCMRRHHLKPVGSGAFRMQVFREANGAWILNQGKRWYVADSESCELQQFESEPPAPGVFVGAFENESGTLRFTQAADLGKAEPLPAGSAAAE